MLNNIADLHSLAPRNISRAITSGRFPNRSGYKEYVPSRIQRICNKAIHRDMNLRYQSPTELRQALERLAFSISWKRVNNLRWEGIQESDVYELVGFSTRTSWKVEYKKNGRRVRDLCRSHFPNNWEAERYIESVVASTSLSG